MTCFLLQNLQTYVYVIIKQNSTKEEFVLTFGQDFIDIIRGKKSIKNINGKNNTVKLPAKKKDIKLSINGNNNYIQLPPKSRIELQVCGNNNVIEFDNDIKGFGAKINVGFPDRMVNNCKLKIGKKSTSNGITIIVLEDNTNISIGENCMLAANLEFWASDAHAITDKQGNLLNLGKEIIIGNNVWIGVGATILKNTIVPDNCIVGAKSVVTGQYNDKNCILAGSPAKIIKKDIVWHRMTPSQYLAQRID